MQPGNRIAINTGFLYVRMLITMVISLYSTRLILNAMGVEDYGLFNLIGGVIALLSFINGAMAVATQRYLSFYLGAGEDQKLKSVFSSSILLHLVIGFIIVLLLELGGIFLFNGVLNIPAELIKTAKIVFHFMVVSTFFTINSVPYDASINAHENFLFDALAGIFESFVKLGIAIFLISARGDKLILYGLLIALLTILIRIIKSIYCFLKYDECRISLKFYIDLSLFKEMISFAGWSLFGSLCFVLRNQGLAIVLNLFFGVVVNAAYGIANQVNGQLSAFSQNMLKALNPQIVKSEGSGDRNRMLRLSILACKLSFFLLAFFAVPLIIEMPYILKIWLKTVPENTLIFCQLILVISLLQQLTVGLMVAITSVGKIKAYQLSVGILYTLNLPLAYILIKLGLPAYSVLVGSIFLECIAGVSRIWFAQRIAGLPVNVFLRETLFNSVITLILITIFSMVPRILIEESIIRMCLTALTSTFSLFIFGKYIGNLSSEFERLKEFLFALFRRDENGLRGLFSTNSNSL
jgi:O-antigen/teichoic acid export membrane protein